MRQYLMELIGTFFLTMAIAFTADPTVIGLMLLAMVYIGANISGAHYNPVLTLAAMVRNKMDLNDGVIYMIAQLAGAVIAGIFFNLVTEDVFAPRVAQLDNIGITFSIEALLAAAFCMVVMTVFGKGMKGNMEYGLVIGFSFIALVGIGGIINPAVAGGSMICNVLKNGPFRDGMVALVYIGAPLVGSLLAVYTQRYLTGEQ
jgi:glycerol uptake facilitator-like aquaporin